MDNIETAIINLKRDAAECKEALEAIGGRQAEYVYKHHKVELDMADINSQLDMIRHNQNEILRKQRQAEEFSKRIVYGIIMSVAGVVIMFAMKGGFTI